MYFGMLMHQYTMYLYLYTMGLIKLQQCQGLKYKKQSQCVCVYGMLACGRSVQYLCHFLADMQKSFPYFKSFLNRLSQNFRLFLRGN